MNNELVKAEQSQYAPMTAQGVKDQVNTIQEIMRQVMKEGTHYGVIPGCEKPSLYKPGAEKIFMTFHLRPLINPATDIIITPLPNGHREVMIITHVLNYEGVELATGIGSASTMESKYRYRNVSDYEITDEPIPKDAKEKKAEYRKQGYGMKKVDGEWKWVRFTDTERSENPDIADTYNTVLKMADKRSNVCGCLKATAASDIFTQDIEDFDHPEADNTSKKPKQEQPPHQSPQRKSASAPVNAGELKTVYGFVIGKEGPNAGGYISFTLDGVDREDGKPAKFSTKDDSIIDALTNKQGEAVGFAYREASNPRFAHSIVKLLEVSPEQSAEMLEEKKNK